ncbi:FecR family protein [Fodinibius roseus]|uniref:FecR family protein n=1 Tax=Fodinibius roseus TaxID=1194090 RepID=A0A1M4UMH0_9BACT|nr:FecR domain-containing protein [Fodinibius roseus]SHE57855.1 FecR family protein [Fodinibius roseus]
MNKEVLHNYVFGNCSPKEKEMVKHWLDESTQNKNIMEELTRIWEVSPGKRIEVDTYKAWDAFSEQYFSYKDSKTSKISKGHALNTGKGHQGPRHRRLRKSKFVAYAIAAAAVILLTVMFYHFVGFSTTDVSPELVKQEITTEKGQRTTIRLSDGTRIHLNAESHLSVAADYNRDKNRIVYLEGEAFFEVASDKQRSFEVHTPRSVTRVLGTEFNVNAYPEDYKVQVVVSEGKVMLGSGESGESPEVRLIRNQKGTIFSDGEVTASKVSDLGIYLDWSRGRLTFRDSPVKEIEQRLERWFNIEVTIAEEITSENRLLTGSFKDVPLSNVLHSIALSLDMDYRREGRTVIFEDS